MDAETQMEVLVGLKEMEFIAVRRGVVETAASAFIFLAQVIEAFHASDDKYVSELQKAGVDDDADEIIKRRHEARERLNAVMEWARGKASRTMSEGIYHGEITPVYTFTREVASELPDDIKKLLGEEDVL